MEKLYTSAYKQLINVSILAVFIIISLSYLNSGLVYAEEDAIIYINSEKHIITDWGYDIKGINDTGNRANSLTEEYAKKLFVEDGMTLLRVPIFAAFAHQEEGELDETVYEHTNQAIRNTLNVRSDVKIFASLKLLGNKTFPDWVKNEKGDLIPEKYASLVADYLKFMQEENLPVHYLGVDNEPEYNEGDMTPEEYKDIIYELWTLALIDGFTVPKLIGPETYGPKVELLEPLNRDGWRDTVDIIGTHYYPEWRPYNNLQRMVGAAEGRSIWNTEVHAFKRQLTEERGFDFLRDSVLSLFENYDLGLSGYVWWDYVRFDVRGEMAVNTVRSTLGARLLEMDDFDGRSLGNWRFNSRAFRQKNDLVIWIVNSRRDLDSYGFQLDQGEFTGPVTYIQWTEDYSTHGEANITADNRFELSFPNEAITYIRVHGVYGPSDFNGYGYLWRELDLDLTYSLSNDLIRGKAVLDYISNNKEEKEVEVNIESTFLTFDAGEWVKYGEINVITKNISLLSGEENTVSHELERPEANGLHRIETRYDLLIDGEIIASEFLNNIINL
ncbi:glycoside hydrolase family 30 protein [Natronospora cellulosivora (SeqCode)]